MQSCRRGQKSFVMVANNILAGALQSQAYEWGFHIAVLEGG